MTLLAEKRYFSIIILSLIALEIYLISSLPGSKAGGGFSWIPVAYHLQVFFLFGFFLFFLIKGSKKHNFLHVTLTLAFSLLYAISDEFHQSFVPLRNSSAGDVFLDFLGIGFSVLTAIFISKKSIRTSISS